MRRILFCNIAYMQYYDFDVIEEIPKHGGKYVAETGDALEKFNFHTCEDGRIRGFVETKYRDSYAYGKKPNQIRIENINELYKNADKIENVLVVFCAHSDTHKKSVIIGWYKDATVYRARREYQNRQYNIECKPENAYLLDDETRNFFVPRASHHNFGFGQSNVWYAKEEQALAFIDSVHNYINKHLNYSLALTETLPQVIPDDYTESGIGKKVFVNRYERNPIARRKCLETHGTHCYICGFNAANSYGEEFKDKIEVHHIIPISKIQSTYKIDPKRDLIPVCPNCHTMLHTKLCTGEFPTIDFLKERISKK